MKKYTTYEEPYANQTFTEAEMHNLYNTDVDKLEYPNFTNWLHDMLKSGVFETIQLKGTEDMGNADTQRNKEGNHFNAVE